MIRHCVFVQFRPEVSPSERAAIYDTLRELQQKIDGFDGVWWGSNVNTEKLAWGFDEGYIIDFRDAAAQSTYNTHPDHPPITERLLAAAQGGLDGVFCFDMEIA